MLPFNLSLIFSVMSFVNDSISVELYCLSFKDSWRTLYITSLTAEGRNLPNISLQDQFHLLVLEIRSDKISISSLHCSSVSIATGSKQFKLHLSRPRMWPEALPPFIIIAACITVTGYSLRFLDKIQNNGKVKTMGGPAMYY